MVVSVSVRAGPPRTEIFLSDSVLAFNLSFLQARMDALTESMAELCLWLTHEKIKPPKVTTYPFADAARAQQDLESGTTTGKLVLVVE